MIYKYLRDITSKKNREVTIYVTLTLVLFFSEASILAFILGLTRTEYTELIGGFVSQDYFPYLTAIVPLCLITLNGLFRYWLVALANNISFSFAVTTVLTILKNYLGYSRGKGVDTSKNDIFTMLLTKIDILASGFFLSLLNFIPAAFLTVLFSALLLFYDPTFLLCVSIYVVLFGILYSFGVSPALTRHSNEVSRFYNIAVQDIREAIEGERDLKVNRMVDAKLSRMSNSLGFARMTHAKLQTLQSVPRQFIELSTALLGFAVILSTTTSNGLGNLVYMMPQFYVLLRMAPQLQSFLGFASNFRSARPILVDVSRMYANSHPTCTSQKLGSVEPTKDQSMAKNISLDSIEMRAISFAYSFGDSELFRSVDLTVRRGECVGIFGKSGSGKSTILDLILGFKSPSAGDIIINMEPDILMRDFLDRGCVAMVSQRNFLFQGTVIENVCFGDDNPDQSKVNQILLSVGLEKFSIFGESGLNYPIRDNGDNISGGEAQRLSLARALYRDPQLLILDEFTSALDSATERQVLSAIMSRRGEMMILVVSHNTSLVDYLDKSYELTDGTLRSMN